MLQHAIKRAFEKKIKGGWHKWPRMYWAIDLHDVIIPGTYTRNNEGREFYPHAEEVLKWLTDRKDMATILFTSSHQDSISEISEWLGKYGIYFDYVNENKECNDNALCSFSRKFYFDVMLEDKAGFEGMSDWLEIKKALIELGQWDKHRSHEE